jgi:hypothetical protein
MKSLSLPPLFIYLGIDLSWKRVIREKERMANAESKTNPNIPSWGRVMVPAPQYG